MNNFLSAPTLPHLILMIIMSISIPFIVYKMQKKYDQYYITKTKLEDERAEHVKEGIDNLIKKMDQFCRRNTDEHDELFTKVNESKNKIVALETTHEINGCNKYHRRLSDSG
jgi:hypothetical protein